MKLRRFNCAVSGALAGILALGVTASAEGPEIAGAEAFIKSLADSAIAVLSDETVTLEEREARFRGLLNDGFALDEIGRFVVGRHWRGMSPDQQVDYREVYGEWVLKTYSARLGGYSGQSFTIVKTVTIGENDIFVRTRIDQPRGGAPIIVDWRVRRIDGRLQIVDVVVEGVSMLVTQRSEFASVVRSRGVEGLIEALRARVSKYPTVAG